MSVSRSKITLWAAGPAILSLLLAPVAVAQETSASARVSNEAETVDLEVLMRGPVHEGFAEPSVSVTAESRERLELADPPPDPIDEQPAVVRPTDTNRDAIWLPGYWGLEGEDELVWVSGTWRYSPPGMRWVPGYWSTTGVDSVWVPGFWIEETVEQITYLPPPPEPRRVDRPQAPGDDYFWVPGHYDWRDGDYVWISGFWAKAHPSWVWVPARYVATPRGYVYVSGYWDYPPERRGTLFAPVRFATVRSGYRYRPTVAINLAQAMVHWFVRPNYGHYYFGNYYGNQYRNFGVQPWVAYVDNRDPYYYDPLYTYYSVSRNDYLRTLVTTRQRITTQSDVRMPVTYRQYQQVVAQGSAPAGIANFATAVDQLVAEGSDGQFERLDEAADTASTERLREDVDSFRRFVQGRRQVELDGQTQQRRSGIRDERAREGERSDDADRPLTERPDGERPRAERPDTERPDAERPDTERPDTERPRTERPDGERPRTERPDTERPRTERPDADRPSAERPSAERPSAERPDTDRPSIEDRVRDAQTRAARERDSQARDGDAPGQDLRDRRGQTEQPSPFDLRPFSRGRAEGGTDRQPGARAEGQAEREPGRAEAGARGEAGARDPLRSQDRDSFTPPPRLRNPAAQERGAQGRGGDVRRGETPGAGGANRGNLGTPAGRENRPDRDRPAGQRRPADQPGAASPGSSGTPDSPAEQDRPAGSGDSSPDQSNRGGGADSDPDEAPE